ncbi:helix-turn-helix domain-containing protein [Flavisolibacter nicotianae]|uniref:helix-turn-helix domain-containing protein n=1 Tax=Flavisolibacter nicotianae TaxID=2364882 RepID=UPI000EB2B20D|nr:helix-turn-helix transcriptional regulator [Flavisolibacter nicotianae]
MKQVGERIREIRNKKNVSIEELANDCEVDYSQVLRMELGKVNFSISYLNKVATALGVNPKELLP